MCEANVYLLEDSKEILVLEDVDKIIPKEDGLYLENIFGQRKTLQASIIEMSLVEHKIILQKSK